MLPQRRCCNGGHTPSDRSPSLLRAGSIAPQRHHAILAATMNRTFRKLFVWLIVALLPLQAVAASFGLTCATVHHQSSQDDGRPALVELAAAHDAHPDHGDGHAGHGGDPVSAATGATDGAQETEAGKAAHPSCSACSAYCVGALAPPSSRLPAPLFEGSDAILVSPCAFAVAFIQDGPQRPPRC
jgi:hypothetical protein